MRGAGPAAPAASCGGGLVPVRRRSRLHAAALFSLCKTSSEFPRTVQMRFSHICRPFHPANVQDAHVSLPLRSQVRFFAQPAPLLGRGCANRPHEPSNVKPNEQRARSHPAIWSRTCKKLIWKSQVCPREKRSRPASSLHRLQCRHRRRYSLIGAVLSSKSTSSKRMAWTSSSSRRL